jgi:cytoskeletal protein CcmA (bactofilin family)
MALFEKNDKPGTAAVRQEGSNVSVRAGEVHTLLGKGSEFEGKLTFEGQVRIDGKFNGQITTKDTLVIGEGARVTAEISAGTVIVNGHVEGNIRAAHLVELHQPGRVKGSIESPSLTMEKGVIFEGTCKMENLGAGGSKSAGISTGGVQVAAQAKPA